MEKTKKGKNQKKKLCLKCLEEKNLKYFYKANSTLYADSLFPVCKTCIIDELKLENPYSKEAIESVQTILQQMNRPFIYNLWISSIEESKNRNMELFGIYWKNVQLNYGTLTWKESDFGLDEDKEQVVYDIIDDKNKVTEYSSKDKEDVIQMLGYDPFYYENEEDKPKLYSNLANLLDESALEDGFKLQAIIEMTRGFNQLDKINIAIKNITDDPDKMAQNSGGIKTLVDTKKNILQSLVKLAEENGISVKHNNQKSKGAGTLSGIIKALLEAGVEEAEMNLFDINTSQGMRQVADMSNESIIKQLQFDENDYTNMLIEQRNLIQDLNEKVENLEEENRLLKKELIEYKNDKQIENKTY